jgi:AcrR family transcriptional regulator
MAAPRGGTRERILNAAEKLFAARGYEGTSTRAIVAASGDTIGSVNYHFGSKEVLLREVVQRRFDVMADLRRVHYRKAAAKAGPEGPTLEAVVDAIVTPYLERALRGGKGWKSYTHLIGFMLFSPKVYNKAINELSTETAREFMNWLARALPHADPGDIAYAYEFMIGCMIEACLESTVDRVGMFTAGRWSGNDFEAVTPRLVCFITAGIAALVAQKPGRKT